MVLAFPLQDNRSRDEFNLGCLSFLTLVHAGGEPFPLQPNAKFKYALSRFLLGAVGFLLELRIFLIEAEPK